MPAKKKVVKKKTAVKLKPKKAAAKTLAVKKEKPTGRVTHFYGGIKVAIVKCLAPLGVGETVTFRGATTDFDEKLTSMQFDHKPIERAAKGKEVGIKVKRRVRVGDMVYRKQ